MEAPGIPTYAARPPQPGKLDDFKDYLEERLKNVDTWAKVYQDGEPKNDPELVYRAPFACVVCHVAPGRKPALPARMQPATATAQ